MSTKHIRIRMATRADPANVNFNTGPLTIKPDIYTAGNPDADLTATCPRASPSIGIDNS